MSEQSIICPDCPDCGSKKVSMFESLKTLIGAHSTGAFNPTEWWWYKRGGELFINNDKGGTVFYRYCGGVVCEICEIFGVEPELV